MSSTGHWKGAGKRLETEKILLVICLIRKATASQVFQKIDRMIDGLVPVDFSLRLRGCLSTRMECLSWILLHAGR